MSLGKLLLAGLGLLATIAIIDAASAQRVKDALPDFSNAAYACNSDGIDGELNAMLTDSNEGHLGMRLIYTKDITEVSRSKDELKCEVTAVTTRSTKKGIFLFHNQDGHALVGWRGSN